MKRSRSARTDASGTDRVAGDDGDPGYDLVREERSLVLAEEVRLVRSECERRKRVDAERLDELLRALALTCLLTQAVAPRREPGPQEPEAGRDRDDEDGEREPFPEAPDDVLRPAQVETDERLGCLLGCEADAVGAVDHRPVDEKRDGAVGEDRGGDEKAAEEHPAVGARIAAAFEVVAPRDEREGKDDVGDRLLVVEALDEMEGGGR
jgi:hypothetical protein